MKQKILGIALAVLAMFAFTGTELLSDVPSDYIESTDKINDGVKVSKDADVKRDDSKLFEDFSKRNMVKKEYLDDVIIYTVTIDDAKELAKYENKKIGKLVSRTVTSVVPRKKEK